ncbi:hypothetical protein P3T76_015928 [Phytophthora citrophthora]|uniref:Uncharacterized protein n=1 Tax=Phytophthora citrophthora TaxID=4793 RepID=A0AAD9FYF3_9STRA|nr:hypothetical protein P3T76_015928 [Phytophthora citrophthora]
MPDMLTEFSRLQLLKLYNSTTTNWDHSAALSGRHHPNLVMLFLVRVNMTDGELPVGLQGNDFPKSLMDIEFCVTNLRGLPDDLDLKWPKSGTIYFEASNLTTVPLALTSISPYLLSLAVNPISDIPGTLLNRKTGYLNVGSTLISNLPETVDISPLFKMRVDHTNISFFWDWVDPMITNDGLVYNSLPTILATGTPYCLELQQILSEKRSNFSVPWSQGQSRSLLNVSPDNLETLKKAVSCEAWPLTLYPIEFEDIYSRIRIDA